MGSRKFTGFQWHPRRVKAVQLVADDTLTDERIAAECGVSRKALANWKLRPEFAERVEEIRAEWREKLRLDGLANRQNRVDALNDRWDRMQKLIDARAEDLASDVAGGETGLLVHQQRAIGTGANQQIIDEYAFDAALLRELREHERQAAQELGQWAEKREHSGPDGSPLQVSANVKVRDFDFDAFRNTFADFLGGGSADPDGPDQPVDSKHAD